MEEHPEGERLQKVLARVGLGSRRAVEQLIAAGRVKVNGTRAELGRRVDITKDKVEVDGSSVPLDVDLAHYLLNKPIGVVTTAADPEGRETVLDIVDLERRVWPVGRLDIDSEGALILTNDGDLTHALTHPSFEVPKTYLAEVGGSVGYKVLRMLARGVELEDGHARATNVALVERTAGGALLEITVTEGRHRLVRRMCDATGHPVKRLVRTSIGPLKLGRLKTGGWRRINPEELRELYRACGL